MAVVNGYCTEAELKATLQVTDTSDDAYIDLAINAASRWIDSYCGQRFWLDSNAVARTYEPCGLYELDVDGIGTTTGLLVDVDTSGDGTYETSWSASDYQLLPTNAPTAGPEAAPWTKIRAVGTQTFPLVYGELSRRDRIRVTAKFGWPAVPEAVHQACILQAGRLFKRKFSLEGVAGFNDFGVVRVSNRLDPDIAALLTDYRSTPILAR